MYNWYKIAFFDETPEDKYDSETISVDYQYNFFPNFKIKPFCVVLNQN